MRKLPVLRTLKSFEAVAGFSSFTHAAATLGLTHGAISHQIRALEDWLGKAVFERHSGGVRLTEDGERLRTVCAQAFSLLEEECSRIRRQRKERSITVGSSATFLAQWILPRIEAFSEKHPDSVLNFQTCTDVAALRSGRVDALIVGELVPSPDDLVGIHLMGDVIGPVCAPGKSSLPQDAKDIPTSMMLHAESRLGAWTEWGTAMGIDVGSRGGRRFETLSLAIQAARGGLGFAISPEILVRDDLGAGRLVAPLGFVAVERATWVYIAQTQAMARDVAAFLQWLCEEAAKFVHTPGTSGRE